MSLKDYRISLMPHITRLVADATAGKAQPLGAKLKGKIRISATNGSAII